MREKEGPSGAGQNAGAGLWKEGREGVFLNILAASAGFGTLI